MPAAKEIQKIDPRKSVKSASSAFQKKTETKIAQNPKQKYPEINGTR